MPHELHRTPSEMKMEWKLKGNEVGREYNWNLNGMEYKCIKKKKKRNGNEMEIEWRSNGYGVEMKWK